MQVLARDGLTAAEVTALLTADALEVTAGLDLLTPALTFVEDISDDLLDGRVARTMAAVVHGTCELQLSRALTWGVDIVRPWMRLTDTTTGTTARWNLGAYCLTTPARDVGETPETHAVRGQDRVSLLQRPVGDDYSVADGVTYRAALLQLFEDAGVGADTVLIDGSAADSVVPVARDWPLVARSTDPDQTTTPVTWVRVVNDLLGAINFRGVWADENGFYRCQAYQEPSARPPEFVFTTDTPRLNIIGEKRRLTQDVWATPNRWVFIASNPPGGITPSEGNGYVYVVENLTDGPTSQTERGLVYPAVWRYEVAGPDALVGLGDRRVALDRAATTQIDLTTGPFPGAGHYDVYTYIDAVAGGERKVQASSWSLPLDGTADMQHVWEALA